MQPTQMIRAGVSSSSAADDACCTPPLNPFTHKSRHLVSLGDVYEGLRREGEKLRLEAGGSRKKSVGLGMWLSLESLGASCRCNSSILTSVLLPGEGIVILFYFKGKRWSSVGLHASHRVPVKPCGGSYSSRGLGSPTLPVALARYVSVPLLILTVEEVLYCMQECAGPSSAQLSLRIFDSVTARRLTLNDILSLLHPRFLRPLLCCTALRAVSATLRRDSRRADNHTETHGQDEYTRGQKKEKRETLRRTVPSLPCTPSTRADACASLTSPKKKTTDSPRAPSSPSEQGAERGFARHAPFTCSKEASHYTSTQAPVDAATQQDTVQRPSHEGANSSFFTASCYSACISSCPSYSPACSAGCLCRHVAGGLCCSPRLSFHELLVYLRLRRSGLRVQRRGLGALAAVIRLSPLFVSSRFMLPSVLSCAPPLLHSSYSSSLHSTPPSAPKRLATVCGDPSMRVLPSDTEIGRGTPECEAGVEHLTETLPSISPTTREKGRSHRGASDGEREKDRTAAEKDRRRQTETSAHEQVDGGEERDQSRDAIEERKDSSNERRAPQKVHPIPRWVVSFSRGSKETKRNKALATTAHGNMEDTGMSQAKSSKRSEEDAPLMVGLRDANVKHQIPHSSCDTDVDEDSRASLSASASEGICSTRDGRRDGGDCKPAVSSTGDEEGRSRRAQKNARLQHACNIHRDERRATHNLVGGLLGLRSERLAAEGGSDTDVLPVFPVRYEENASSLLPLYLDPSSQHYVDVSSLPGSCLPAARAPNATRDRVLPSLNCPSRVSSSLLQKRKLPLSRSHVRYLPPAHKKYCTSSARRQKENHTLLCGEQEQEAKEGVARGPDETDEEEGVRVKKHGNIHDTLWKSVVVGAASADGPVALIRARAVALL
ncbi:hypothetical protein CSUI_006549 [Cystoisospora suis]|uniref:Uncharacterized protein n=1 Tax=Cystoisospora suis TaxID=483139 RepID=A0A2C6KTN1_9APIC|nr:hypothetical protein CSUI_006549 [Cystoisospora suis]